MNCEDYDFDLTDRNSYYYIDLNDMNIKQIICYIKKNKSIKYNREMTEKMVNNLMNLDDMGALASHYDKDGKRVYYASEPLFSMIIQNLETLNLRMKINQKNFDEGLV